jgi:lysophospholipid acyltransferase (LPLAT)-like uncharacterized protein
MVRALLGLVVGCVARLWLATLRVHLEVHPELAREERPWVLAFFHGSQWPLLAWKRRRTTAVMVSLSADGAVQARALGVLGFEVVRGSSSRGGVRGLMALVRKMRSGGRDAAFAVDGPRGPYGVAKPGAVVCARRAAGVLVPMGSAVSGGYVFGRAWDRFVLAWPFTRVAVVLGRPRVARDATDSVLTAGLTEAVGAANARAAALLAAKIGVGAAKMVPSPEPAPASLNSTAGRRSNVSG